MTKKVEKETRLNIRISESLRNDFRRICNDKSVNGSDLVRKFIERWVSENRK